MSEKSHPKKAIIGILILFTVVSLVAGGVGGVLGGYFLPEWVAQKLSPEDRRKTARISEESDVVSAVENATPAVVSIIVTKDLPKIRRYYQFSPNNYIYRQEGTEKREIGGGTGFIVSTDGFIVTNKHVVSDSEADYTVLMNNEETYEAQVLALDPINDIAVLKIEGNDFPIVELGDSSELKVGQTVIAIGNALGEFTNTVSVGVVSGLSRSLTAQSSRSGQAELLGVIQTDASINPGNSGGPLLNVAGQVLGINTAIVSNAQNIGFAIPINEAVNTIDSVKKYGKIIRPWLGVRYVQLNETIAESNNLPVDYGALVVRGDERTDLAVMPGSPADKAGLVENDIILEINGEKLEQDNPLYKVLFRYAPGEKVTLTILHRGEEKEVTATLGEME